MSTSNTVLSSARNGLAAHRAARRDRADFLRELADYDTPAQRQDLDAILDRYPAEQADQVRGLRLRQALRA